MSSEKKPAVVLTSGGLDSSTVLAIAQSEGYDLYALTINYGQRHTAELSAAEQICEEMEVADHLTLSLDLRSVGGSALTTQIPVPKHDSVDDIDEGIPITYVPARNTVFLSLALGWAEKLGAFDIFLGVNAVDYSGYPDCRPEFIAAFQNLANLATKAGVEGSGEWRIHTPLIDLTKADIIRRGVELGVDYGLTVSCYDPGRSGNPCGACDACLLRQRGFADAGLVDPLPYPGRS